MKRSASNSAQVGASPVPGRLQLKAGCPDSLHSGHGDHTVVLPDPCHSTTALQSVQAASQGCIVAIIDPTWQVGKVLLHSCICKRQIQSGLISSSSHSPSNFKRTYSENISAGPRTPQLPSALQWGLLCARLSGGLSSPYFAPSMVTEAEYWTCCDSWSFVLKMIWKYPSPSSLETWCFSFIYM